MDEGWHVRGTVRSLSESAALPGAVEIVETGSFDAYIEWEAALEGIGTVVHLAARAHKMDDSIPDPMAAYRKINASFTEHLAQIAASQSIRRFVFVSSAKVNGEGKSIAYTEDDRPEPVGPYAISKFEAEMALKKIADETGLEVVIVRPPLVYGPRVKANFLRLLQVVDKGIPLPLANVQNKRSLIYLDNLIDGIVACIQHPEAANRTFLISDGGDISTSDLLRTIASSMGKSPMLFSFPERILRVAAGLTGKSAITSRLLDTFRVDISKIETLINWSPPFTLQEGIGKTAHWYLEEFRKSLST